MKITKKQEAFAVAYVKCGIATKAFEEAGYSVSDNENINRVNAHRVLKNTNVVLMIDALKKDIRDKAAENLYLTKESHLQKLEELRDKATEAEKYDAAIRAEMARGKAMGYYVDKTELTGKDGSAIGVNINHVSDMSDEELQTALAKYGIKLPKVSAI